MSILPRAAAALLGAALLLGEAGIGAAAVFLPRVSQMYRDVFIAGTRDCWLPPRAEAAAREMLARPQIDVSGLDARAACYLQARGFEATPPWGVTAARHAWLDLPESDHARSLALTLAAASSQTVWIGFRENQGIRLALPGGGQPVTVQLNPPAQDGVVQIRFHRPRAPDEGQMHVLRLQWMDP